MKKIVRSLIFLSALVSPILVFAQAKCMLNGQEVPCEQFKSAGWAIGGFFLVFMVIMLLLFIFWLWMLIHAASKPIENKAVWIILMVLLGPIVSIIYYFVVKRKFVETAPPTPVQQPPTVPPTPVA